MNTMSNVIWHERSVNKSMRAERFKQKPALIWFTGLSGSGKSTSAFALEKKLFNLNYNTYALDGDNVRHGLCSDLGFSDADRNENIRRVGEVAKLMLDAGFIVVASFISPFVREREIVRKMLKPGEFIEVYVNTLIDVCEQRDPKGLYRKARNGEIKNFTGIDSPYEPPTNHEIEINAGDQSTDEIVEKLMEKLT
jgi:bifunctional enzyme CysN/CysC